MENAVDALKIAFAVFVFIIALTVTFSMIAKLKSTAEYVLYYTDRTNFYSRLNTTEKNRTVSVNSVIAMLYRYYNETVSVTVDLTNVGKGIRTFDVSNNTSIDKNAIEKDLENYIEENLQDLKCDFLEEFVDAPISGIYETGIDGTEVVLSSGGKKVYIKYIAQKI